MKFYQIFRRQVGFPRGLPAHRHLRAQITRELNVFGSYLCL